MGRSIALLILVGCGTSGHHGYYLAGECDPAAGTTPVATTEVSLVEPSCLRDTTTNLTVVDSVAQWNALFDCSTAVPTGVDLTNGRAAIAQEGCSPVSLRFVSESDAEVVVGVLTGISGACIRSPLVVPLARSTKPVRLAQCNQQCDECPPVP
jgi:hypothetical protein